MPSSRLQQQFIRLWQCCDGHSQETTLNELAALLNCSRRHMRTLLNTMAVSYTHLTLPTT